jgi:hypothetical protein
VLTSLARWWMVIGVGLRHSQLKLIRLGYRYYPGSELNMPAYWLGQVRASSGLGSDGHISIAKRW